MALERLTTKQKRRQYSASSVSSNVLTSVSSTHCSAADDSETAVPSHPPKPRRMQSAHVRAWQHSSAARRRNEEDSEDCESRRRGSDDPGSERGGRRLRQSSATGQRADDATTAVYFDSQRSMIEQSRALLEQSKAKHHALVAQAHSMQKRLQAHQYLEPQPTEAPTALTPKPPSASPADKKPTSTFRTQRLARYSRLVHTHGMLY